MDKQDNRMNRRDFLKIVGISTAGTAVALSGCSPKESTETAAEGPVPTGKMTYRNFTDVCAGLRFPHPRKAETSSTRNR